MSLSKAEQETIILFNEAEPTADVFTYNKHLITKLRKLNAKYPTLFYPNRKDFKGAVSYTVPKNCVVVRPPYSDARKEADSTRALLNGVTPPRPSF